MPTGTPLPTSTGKPRAAQPAPSEPHCLSRTAQALQNYWDSWAEWWAADDSPTSSPRARPTPSVEMVEPSADPHIPAPMISDQRRPRRGGLTSRHMRSFREFRAADQRQLRRRCCRCTNITALVGRSLPAFLGASGLNSFLMGGMFETLMIPRTDATRILAAGIFVLVFIPFVFDPVLPSPGDKLSLVKSRAGRYYQMLLFVFIATILSLFSLPDFINSQIENGQTLNGVILFTLLAAIFIALMGGWVNAAETFSRLWHRDFHEGLDRREAYLRKLTDEEITALYLQHHTPQGQIQLYRALTDKLPAADSSTALAERSARNFGRYSFYGIFGGISFASILISEIGFWLPLEQSFPLVGGVILALVAASWHTLAMTPSARRFHKDWSSSRLLAHYDANTVFKGQIAVTLLSSLVFVIPEAFDMHGQMLEALGESPVAITGAAALVAFTSYGFLATSVEQALLEPYLKLSILLYDAARRCDCVRHNPDTPLLSEDMQRRKLLAVVEQLRHLVSTSWNQEGIIDDIENYDPRRAVSVRLRSSRRLPSSPPGSAHALALGDLGNEVRNPLESAGARAAPAPV